MRERGKEKNKRKTYLRWLLGDGVEVTGPLITVLGSHHGLRIGDLSDTKVRLDDLHTEAGNALVRLRNA